VIVRDAARSGHSLVTQPQPVDVAQRPQVPLNL
jgi:hypothetical protein